MFDATVGIIDRFKAYHDSIFAGIFEKDLNTPKATTPALLKPEERRLLPTAEELKKNHKRWTPDFVALVKCFVPFEDEPPSTEFVEALKWLKETYTKASTAKAVKDRDAVEKTIREKFVVDGAITPTRKILDSYIEYLSTPWSHEALIDKNFKKTLWICGGCQTLVPGRKGRCNYISRVCVPDVFGGEEWGGNPDLREKNPGQLGLCDECQEALWGAKLGYCTRTFSTFSESEKTNAKKLAEAKAALEKTPDDKTLAKTVTSLQNMIEKIREVVALHEKCKNIANDSIDSIRSIRTSHPELNKKPSEVTVPKQNEMEVEPIDDAVVDDIDVEPDVTDDKPAEFNNTIEEGMDIEMAAAHNEEVDNSIDLGTVKINASQASVANDEEDVPELKERAKEGEEDEEVHEDEEQHTNGHTETKKTKGETKPKETKAKKAGKKQASEETPKKKSKKNASIESSQETKAKSKTASTPATPAEPPASSQEKPKSKGEKRKADEQNEGGDDHLTEEQTPAKKQKTTKKKQEEHKATNVENNSLNLVTIGSMREFQDAIEYLKEVPLSNLLTLKCAVEMVCDQLISNVKV